MKIFKSLYDSFIIIIFGAMVFVAGLSLSGVVGCQSMYDENGKLTPATQQTIQKTTEAITSITDTVAPAGTPIVNAIAGLIGGACVLVGQIFYKKSS